MTSNKLNYTVTLSLTAFLLQSCDSVSAEAVNTAVNQTQNISTLLESSEVAREFNYCAWAFEQGGKKQTLPDFESMLDRETSSLSPDQWAATALADAGTRIAKHAKSQKSCARTFAKGIKKFDKNIKKALKKHWSLAKYETSEDVGIAKVQADLADHWVEDQAARSVYIGSRTEDEFGAEHWTRRLAATRTSLADASSTEFMKTVLEEYDWIDIKRFGERVSMAAWLMVQHADQHVELQRLALSRMEPYLKTQGVSKKNYAFLWDRVAVNSGEKQRYGTQPTWVCTSDGNLTLKPLEDPENVNVRRAEMGMNTVEEGLEEMANSICR